MSPGRGLMKAFHQVVASSFGDIESIFEIKVSMLIYPILLVSSWKPGFSGFIIHGSEGFEMMRSKEDEEVILVARARSNGRMWWSWSSSSRRMVSQLSLEVSTSSFRDRALAGPMLIPHSTPHLMSKSCMNRLQWA